MNTCTKADHTQTPEELSLPEAKVKLEKARQELLITTLINYMFKHGGTKFCLLIVDIKRKSPPKGLQYGEAVADNPFLGENPLSLDVSIGDDDFSPLVDTYASDTPTPEEHAARNSTKRKLEWLIDTSKISERNKEILCRYYGLKHFLPATYEEIGTLFEITSERARQIVASTTLSLQRKVAREQLSRDHF